MLQMAYLALTKKSDHLLVDYFYGGWPSSDVEKPREFSRSEVLLGFTFTIIGIILALVL